MSEPFFSAEISAFFDSIGSIDQSCRAEIEKRCEFERRQKLGIPYWTEFVQDLAAFKSSLNLASANQWTVQEDGVVSTTAEFDESTQNKIETFSRFLHPWRKGPYQFGSLQIDAEWRSNWKWDRIQKKLPSMTGKVILDCGCNNGYYLFRMAESSPKAILAIDPNDRFYFQYDFARALTGLTNTSFELLGVEDIEFFPPIFDIVFCLGVIYHRRDPLGMLTTLKKAMKPGGCAVIESITLPGQPGQVTYIPDRYSQMRNVFFLPSPDTLALWMTRVGFKQVSIIDQSVTTTAEQRQTEFATFDSLPEFLDPADSSKTIEGYPAPARTVVIGYS